MEKSRETMINMNKNSKENMRIQQVQEKIKIKSEDQYKSSLYH